jgi:hypothetical protein
MGIYPQRRLRCPREFLARRKETVVPAESIWSFGWGPVEIPRLYNGKQKTFFFFAYQGFRYSQPASNNLLVPTATQLSGDFSALCQTGFTAGICNDHDSDGNAIDQIYNPFTTMVDNTKTSGFSRQPFAGNIIPSNLIDSRLVGFAQAIYPAAGNYNAATISNAIDTNTTSQTQKEYNVRIDHNFGQKDSAWFRYSRINSTIPQRIRRAAGFDHPLPSRP